MPVNEHWLLPDDVTKCEQDIFLLTLENIYGQFNDPIDKLIIALAFELNYPKKAVGRLIGRTDVAVSVRIKKIKTVLSTTYRAYVQQ